MDLEKIKKYLDRFAKERGWEEKKSPKNISMALAVEAAELMEIFQWMEREQSFAVGEETMEAIRGELADILSYLIQFSTVLDIDLEQAFWDKVPKNEKKHPPLSSVQPQ